MNLRKRKVVEDKITPFSNGTEFMVWRDENCDRCKKANLEAVERDKTCPMEYDTSFASVTDGLIPKESAERIGYKTEPYFHLTKCKELEVK
jgi:hypothetical protein